MRQTNAALTTAINKKFTNPIQMIAQDMGANVIYSSTQGLIDYDGQDYLGTTGAQVHQISNNTFSWSLDNSDRAYSVMALANDVGGNTVTLFMHYDGETIVRFTGVIDEWNTQGQRIMFRATSQASRLQKFPNERAENGVFNHLPPPGSSILWGLQTIILESEPV